MSRRTRSSVLGAPADPAEPSLAPLGASVDEAPATLEDASVPESIATPLAGHGSLRRRGARRSAAFPAAVMSGLLVAAVALGSTSLAPSSTSSAGADGATTPSSAPGYGDLYDGGFLGDGFEGVGDGEPGTPPGEDPSAPPDRADEAAGEDGTSGQDGETGSDQNPADADGQGADETDGDETGGGEHDGDAPADENVETGGNGTDDDGTPGDQTGSQDEASDDGDEPKDEQGPAPTSSVEELNLVLSLREGDVKVDWTISHRDGFALYKIVRSLNPSITWPLGEGDRVITVIENRETTAFMDRGAPAGKRVYYRVFAMRHGESGYRAIGATGTRSIVTPRPEPDPAETHMNLIVSLKEGVPYVDWTKYRGDGFDLYKVVRSTDSTVRWPLGENNKLVGGFENIDKTAMFDEGAPHGKHLYYRVFAVRHSGEGYRVLASSNVDDIRTPGGEPKPEPYLLGFEIETGEGGVILHWEPCGSDGFVAYKIVRSMTNSNPKYPLNSGTSLAAVIENPNATSFFDGEVESGQHWFYRVYSMGKWDGQWVVLGVTPVRDVTVP